MEFDPKIYNRMNRAQRADAKETIQRILMDGFGTVATILDIGCGTGNVTRMVAESISHERIIAIDVDPQMIQFARENNDVLNTVEFLVQDIALPFEQLDPKLREFEGKVDLIWSNRVLHWVADKDKLQVAQNILRLLKPGGKAYMNITLLFDFVALLPPDQREVVQKVLRIPSLEEQGDTWRRKFRTAGATSVSVTYEQRSYDLENNKDFQLGRHFVKTSAFRHFLPDTMTLEEKNKFLEPFDEEFLRCCGGPVGQPLPKEKIDTATVYYYGQYHVIVTK